MKSFRIPYNTWKMVVQANEWTVYENPQGSDSVYAYSGNRDFLYGTSVDADDYGDYSTVFPTRTIVTTVEEAEALIYGLSTKIETKTTEGLNKLATVKSYEDTSTSFVSCNFAAERRDSWFYNATEVVDEVATTSDDTTYSFGSAAGSKEVINERYVTDRKRFLGKFVSVKKNDVAITSGFTVNHAAKTIVFDSANSGSDVVRVSYSYESGSLFELVADSGKVLRLDYVETQFSQGCAFNDTLRFELILNNAATGNQDYMVGYEEYQTAADFLSKGNHGSVLGAFGELEIDVNVFPWDYLSGYTIYPVGTVCDPYKNQFNKIKMYLVNDLGYGSETKPCEIATGTFYCFVEDL